MNCPECEANLRRGARFCDRCGAKIIGPEEKVLDLSPVVAKFLGGIGTGLKFLGEMAQECARTVKKEEEEKK